MLVTFNECFKHALAGKSPGMIFTLLMEKMVQNIPIKHGFIGEKFKNDDNQIFLRYYALYGFDNYPVYMETYHKQGYVDYIPTEHNRAKFDSMETGKPLIINNMKTHRQNRSYPEGHPEIVAYAAFPLIHEEQTLGTVGLARDEPFSEEILLMIPPYIDLIRNVMVCLKYIASIETHKTIFMANMSHELRTPLNGIICMSKMLSRTRISSEQDEYVNIINHCSVQLLDIVNDILDYSKIKSGTLKLHIKPMSLNKCVVNVINMLEPKARDKGLLLQWFIAPDVPNMIISDNIRISQILSNIITNAIKFTRKGSVQLNVQVKELDADNCELYLSIKDTGIGMSEEKLRTIFDTFRWVNNNYLCDTVGLGLGLPITKHIVSMMDGKIWIHSKSEAGTTVNITIKTQIFRNNISQKQLSDHFTGNRALLFCENHKEKKLIFESMQALGIQPVLASNNEDVSLYLGNKMFAFNFVILDCKAIDKSKFPSPEPGTIKVCLVDAPSSPDNSPRASSNCDLKLVRPVTDTNLMELYNIIYVSNQSRIIPVIPSPELGQEHLDINILIAEDNKQNQQVLIKLLNSLGYYNIEVAHDGLEMYVKLCNNSTSYDIAFVDLKMPIIDGLTASRKFRADSTRNTMLVAVTASVSDQIKDKCMEVGMNGYIGKPIDIKELEAIMEIIIKKKLSLR